MVIKREMLFGPAYYKKAVFFGSRGKYNFRIARFLQPEDDKEYYLLTVWEGPECFDKTKREKRESYHTFDEPGMEEIVTLLNGLQ